jgi:hypothetical protein
MEKREKCTKRQNRLRTREKTRENRTKHQKSKEKIMKMKGSERRLEIEMRY